MTTTGKNPREETANKDSERYLYILLLLSLCLRLIFFFRSFEKIVNCINYSLITGSFNSVSFYPSLTGCKVQIEIKVNS